MAGTVTGGMGRSDMKDIEEFKVGDPVRCERDEVMYRSKGTWPRYWGRVGTVVTLNGIDDEIGVVFGSTCHRPDGSLSGGLVTWFQPFELRATPAVSRPSKRR